MHNAHKSSFYAPYKQTFDVRVTSFHLFLGENRAFYVMFFDKWHRLCHAHGNPCDPFTILTCVETHECAQCEAHHQLSTINDIKSIFVLFFYQYMRTV